MSWYWLEARFQGVWHLLLGHKVLWRDAADELCPGDIVCETCDLVIWCRACDPWSKPW